MSNFGSRIEINDNARKRKFTPNISKALTKKTVNDESKPSSKTSKPKHSENDTRTKKGRINRKFLDNEEPRFVQSFSMFETGVGCVVKSDVHAVEMQAVGGRAKSTFEQTPSDVGAEIQRPVNSFLTDLQQCFKLPPTTMSTEFDEEAIELMPIACQKKDTTAIKTRAPTKRSGSLIPAHLFDETSSVGSLFSLQLPEALLSEESPLMKEGKFGKIQLLENGETRLVISDSVFRLICPHPNTYSSDVVVLEEQEDGIVGLNSLGHLDQTVSAVPDLDRFSSLGR